MKVKGQFEGTGWKILKKSPQMRSDVTFRVTCIIMYLCNYVVSL